MPQRTTLDSIRVRADVSPSSVDPELIDFGHKLLQPAKKLLALCQRESKWGPFTEKQLQEGCGKDAMDDLIREAYLMRGEPGNYRVAVNFTDRCVPEHAH